jgi:DNA-binding transcriptional ArsR family regulator
LLDIISIVVEISVDALTRFPYFDDYRIMEATMESETVVRALGALAQEHRLALFRLLVQAGPEGLAAGAIAEALGVPASSLSFHLAQLTNAGLIAQRRDGRSLIYSADYRAMTALLGFLMENCCGGAVCAPAAPCDTKDKTERTAV